MTARQSTEKTSAPAGCEYHAGTLTYQCSMFSWGSVIFLSIFMLGWTFACTVMVYSYLTKGEPEIWFCGIFCLVDIGVIIALLYVLFGSESGYLDKTGFHRKVNCLIFTWEKDIPLEKIRQFRIGKNSSFKQNNRPATCVDILTDEAPYKFISRFSYCPVQNWIVENGNDFLACQAGARRGSAASITPNSDDSALSVQDMFSIESEKGAGFAHSNDEDDEDYDEDGEPIIETYKLSENISSVASPQKTDWLKNKDFDSVSFEKKGRFSWSIFPLLFATVFWNSIVSVFVCVLWGIAPIGIHSGHGTHNAHRHSQVSKENADSNATPAPVSVQGEKKYVPLRERTININGKDEPMFGGAWWFLFCFLIPFELIGLGFIISCIMVLLAPFSRLIWVFKRHDAIRTKRFFGIPFTREYSLGLLYQMENNQTQAAGTTQGSLVFRDRNSKELFRIAELSSQEARWMAGEIRRIVK